MSGLCSVRIAGFCVTATELHVLLCFACLLSYIFHVAFYLVVCQLLFQMIEMYKWWQFSINNI
jgi:hypothetical protein